MMKFFKIILLLTFPLNAFADGKITNADVYSAASILFTKMQAETGHNVCTFNSSGFIAGGVAPGTSGNVLTSNGTDWTSAATTAALSIGALDAQAANANGLALVSNVLSTQSADATHPGVVNNTTQTLSGAKTFTSSVKVPAANATTPSVYLDTGGGEAGFYFGGSGFTFAYNTADVFSFINSEIKSNVQIQMFLNTDVNTPGIFFLNEGHTGFYRVSADDWGFTSNGTKILDMGIAGLGVTGNVNISGLTVSRAVATDGSDNLVSSATTATELGYVNGVTSAIQTQLNGKQASGNYITALTGDITASGPGSVAATLATVNGNVGSFTNGSFTVNAKGLITAASSGTAPVTSISVATANGLAGSSSGGATPALTLSTTVTGILSGNGTTISAASTTGSGSVVLATSPTIVTPTIAKLANLTTNGFVKTSGGDGTLGVQTSPIPAADINGGRTINAQSGTTYTFVLADASNAGGFPLVMGSNASAETFTVPPQSSVVWLAGAQIDVCQQGAGKLTLAQGSGVTINSKSSNKSISAQYVCVTLIRTASDVWTLAGDLIP